MLDRGRPTCALALRLAAGDPPPVSPQDLAVEDLRLLQGELRAQKRCSSLSTTSGWPCPRRLQIGYSACARHRQPEPEPMRKSERALAAVRRPAIQWIADEIEQAAQSTCQACGYPRLNLKDRKRIDALAIRVLDRTGLGPTAKIAFERPNDDNGLPLHELTAAENDELETILGSMDAFRERVQARLARAAVAVLVVDAAALPPAPEGSGPAPGPGDQARLPPIGGE